MKIYETLLTEYTTVKIRVRANSKEEAEKIFDKFQETDSDYLAEELDMAGTSEWLSTKFKEVHPARWDEAATITMNNDGSFDAIYEGGES